MRQKRYTKYYIITFLITIIAFTTVIKARIPLYTLFGFSYGRARLATDPISSLIGWPIRKIRWFDRPKSKELSAEIHDLKDRLYPALKLIKEDYISPERQVQMDALEVDFNQKMAQLKQDREDDKIGYWAYRREKNKIEDEYEDEMDLLKPKNITSWFAKLRWKVMVVDVWASWWKCYRFSFNYRISNLRAFVDYVERETL